MAAEWMDTTLGEVLTLQRGFDLPGSDRRPGCVPVVSSSGITGTHDEAKVRAPGVVTGRYGTLGEVHFVEADFWSLNTTLYVRDFKGNDPQFVYYLLRSLDFSGFNDKSSVPGLNRNHLHTIPVRVPTTVAEQRAIAHILGTLDDKIELNRRMNQTLEEIARTLFKSWFVDFDPVRAKAEGRQPEGMDAETAALFPDSFVDSALGRIPFGWRACSVEDLASRIAMGPFGSRITRDNFVSDGVPVIRGSNLTDGFQDADFVYLTEAKAEELRSAAAFPGDIVFTHRGTLGQVGMIPKTARYPRYIVSQSQMLLSVDRNTVSPTFLYLFFRSSGGQAALLANTSTTGVPAISRPTTSLKQIKLVSPPRPISDGFERIVGPTFDRMETNEREPRTLVAIRDTLLPRLLSGELRVCASGEPPFRSSTDGRSEIDPRTRSPNPENET